VVGGKLPGLTPELELDRTIRRALEQVIDRNPGCSGYLCIEGQLRTGGEQKDEGPDGNGRQGWCPGNHVGQPARELLAPEPHTDFLQRLSDCGVDQVGIGRGAAPARQGHVSGPRVARAVGATDQKQGVGRGNEDESHRRPEQGGIRVIGGRVPRREPFPQPVETVAQWLCEWQLPPQHPPLEGGPSRLKSAGFPADAGRAVRDISRSSFRLSHSGQATVASPRTRRSKVVSQEEQR